jgi:hypothetical protein
MEKKMSKEEKLAILKKEVSELEKEIRNELFSKEDVDKLDELEEEWENDKPDNPIFDDLFCKRRIKIMKESGEIYDKYKVKER